MVKRKSMISVLIVALALLVSTVSVGMTPVRADSDAVTKITDAVCFTIDEDTDTKEKTVTAFELPDGVTGKFEIVIPDGVTAIGDSVFDSTDNLVGVSFPASLKTIGHNAFTNTALASVRIPASVTVIGQHAFNGCTELSELTFESRTAALTVNMYAFNGCVGLVSVDIPANTTVNQFAFNGCSSLLWVYMGENSEFKSTSDISGVRFFPTNTPLTIVFPSAEAYNAAIADEKFGNSNGKSATYIVNVNFHIGTETMVHERLFGKEFNYVADKDTGRWNTDTVYSVLPAQAAHYASTVWYSDTELTKVVRYYDVTTLLAGGSDIDLYCHETVPMPVLPEEPVSWVYDSKVSYESTDLADVLKAMGCKQEFTEQQLAAMDFSVLFADENGKSADTPSKISDSGAYSVAVSLKREYGSWIQTVGSTITVNVDTSGFNIVLIVFLIVGAIAVAVTVSTAVIRKKVQARNRKKKLTQQEALEKFKALGGETTLQ